MTTDKTEVKRYNITTDKYYHPVPYETEHGQWVKYSSYKDLQAECRILESELATVKKVAYGNVDLLDECEKLRAERDELHELIPRPTKQEWEGGLPPVGVDCEIRYLGYYNNNWMPFRATAITNDFVVGCIKSEQETAVKRKDPYVEFRPLKSKQERQREKSK